MSTWGVVPPSPHPHTPTHTQFGNRLVLAGWWLMAQKGTGTYHVPSSWGLPIPLAGICLVPTGPHVPLPPLRIRATSLRPRSVPLGEGDGHTVKRNSCIGTRGLVLSGVLSLLSGRWRAGVSVAPVGTCGENVDLEPGDLCACHRVWPSGHC